MDSRTPRERFAEELYTAYQEYLVARGTQEKPKEWKDAQDSDRAYWLGEAGGLLDRVERQL